MTDRDTITRTRARAPGVGGAFHRMAVQYIASTDPTLCGSMLKHEGRRQTDRRSADAGSRLKLIDASGRSRLIRQPFSRNGENSPYGMLGGIVETSASFEARSAPRSYPTNATDPAHEARDRVLGRLAQMRLYFAEGRLDRVEIRRIWRQKTQRRARCFDCLLDAGNLVGWEIVHDDDIA